MLKKLEENYISLYVIVDHSNISNKKRDCLTLLSVEEDENNPRE